MGPSSGDDGNHVGWKFDGLTGRFGLQWGRRLVTTEISPLAPPGAEGHGLLWGRRLVTTEIGKIALRTGGMRSGFNGAVVW